MVPAQAESQLGRRAHCRLQLVVSHARCNSAAARRGMNSAVDGSRKIPTVPCRKSFNGIRPALRAAASANRCLGSRHESQSFPSHSALASYVDAYWDYQDLTGEANSFLSILPDTATYLCFLYDAPLLTTHKTSTYRTRSGLAGFQSFRSDLSGSGAISGVSARLTPWGLNVFRRGIVKECAERRVDCRDIFPKYTIERIEDDLALIASAEERVAYIEHHLLSIFCPQNDDLVVRRACEQLAASKGNCRIADLASSLGLAKRTLERRFLNQIGATPKKVSRVIRLRNAIILGGSGARHGLLRSKPHDS